MKKNRVVPKTVKLADAKFAYFSVCHQSIAEKPACAMPQGKGIGMYVGAKPEGDTSLGSWTCSTCRKPCKVTRAAKSEVVPVQADLTHV